MPDTIKPLILVVDDNDAGRYTTVRIIRAAGFAVIEAATGDETLEKARQMPDLIVLDIQLPDINGIEVCKRLKADPVTRSIPVLHLTSTFVNSKDKVEGLEGGADGYLFQPVEAAELIATINALLRLKRAEHEKEQEARQWQTTFDAISDAVCLLDTSGRILRHNAAFRELSGKNDTELNGQFCYQVVHGTTGFIADCPTVRALKSGHRESMELESGGHWFQVSIDPVLNAVGDISSLVHIMQDITESKRAEDELHEQTVFLKEEVVERRAAQEALQKQATILEEEIEERLRLVDALRASENRFRQLLESVQMIAITLDKAGTITFCNSYLAELTGWSKEEIVGLNWFDLFIPVGSRDAITAIFTTGIAGGGLPSHYENQIITRYGKLRMIVWDNSILLEPDNTITGIAGIASIGIDITEYRHLEEQLRHSQKMEAVGQLAGGVAHDFNNILSVIMGYGGMLKMDTGLNAAQQEKMDYIMEAAERAAQLTGALLAFSRKQTLTPKNVNLNDIINHLQKFLVRVIGEDIHLNSIVHEVELPVCIDSGQIEQVLINLATNARDAMDERMQLSIETGIQEIDAAFAQAHGYGQAGRYAVITFADTGKGMDEETQKKIFEPFFTTKEVGKGTGLGLAIVYGIIKQHNGFINLYSEPGKGTTFRIYLPLVAQEAASGKEQIVIATPKGGSETILVAEDDPSVRTLVTSFLTSYGYTVLQAEDGEEAVARFAANRGKIQLILMDMIMPKLNGKGAADQIRQLQPGTRILFTSGYTADFIKNRGVDEEGIELIMKPVQPMELLRKIREMLDL